MWESPITMITENIARDIISKTDGTLIEYVHTVGFDVDKEELMKALAYDRGQYEKGYSDGRMARDAEIVRCKECKHSIMWRDAICKKELLSCRLLDGLYVKDDGFCSSGERKEG